MPRGDRRGPAGYGPMTGRGAGYCAGSAAPGYATAPPPPGGRGRRRMYHATWAPPEPYLQQAPVQRQEPEREMLELRANMVEKELEAIRARLKELEGEESQ